MANIDDLRKTLEQGVTLAKEGVVYAAEKAEGLSLAAALRLRIFALRRRMERQFTELGEVVYGLAAKNADPRADAGVKRRLKNLARLEREVNELFAELDQESRGEKPRRRKPGKKKTSRAAPKRKRKADR